MGHTLIQNLGRGIGQVKMGQVLEDLGGGGRLGGDMDASTMQPQRWSSGSMFTWSDWRPFWATQCPELFLASLPLLKYIYPIPHPWHHPRLPHYLPCPFVTTVNPADTAIHCALSVMSVYGVPWEMCPLWCPRPWPPMSHGLPLCAPCHPLAQLPAGQLRATIWWVVIVM